MLDSPQGHQHVMTKVNYYNAVVRPNLFLVLGNLLLNVEIYQVLNKPPLFNRTNIIHLVTFGFRRINGLSVKLKITVHYSLQQK
jgi:hypothetical protein